jgi:N-acetyl-anhydromuramyl-L-alanine amidase AmpD
MPLVIEDRLKNAELQDVSPRHGVKVDTLVLHTTEGGSIAGAVEWWRRKEVIGSAHYLLTADRIERHVEEWLCAFHAGNRAMNRRSIGIEVVGKCGDPGLWSPAVMRQLVLLSADIVRRHGIPVLHQPGPGICGHADVPDPSNPNLRGGLSHHTDPGPHFPWGRYLDDLRAELRRPTA